MTENMTLEQYEQLRPMAIAEFQGEKIAYSTPNQQTLWRVQTLLTKEPDTIEWISTFDATDVLVDIGANVGMYTILAAKTRGVRVFAFEPEAQNFALLNRNVQNNRLSGKVTAYCVALSDETRFDKLHLSAGDPGGSCHSFAESVNYNLQPTQFPLSQGCFATTLDDLVSRKVVPAPQHIKIDVDGLEHKVLAGAEQTLRSPDLKSVLVEINTNLILHREIIERMQQIGFEYSEQRTQAHLQTQGPFAGVGNYIFQRRAESQNPNIHRLTPGGNIIPPPKKAAG